MMMRRLTSFVFLFSLLGCVNALAYDLEGIVYDFDRKPLSEAIIRLLTVQRVEVGNSFTDKNGSYSIKNVPAGTYTMEISKMGMKTVDMEISIGGHQYDSTVFKDIYLHEIMRFESIKPSELKALFIPEGEEIPRGAFSIYLKGVKKLNARKYKRALKDFQKAIKRHPGFSRCYTHIGEIYAQEKKHADSEKAFLKAIELNPEDPIPYREYGRLLIELRRYDSASWYLEMALDRDSARAENYFLLGKAQYHLGQSDKAEKHLLQGLMMQSRETGDTRIILADMYSDQKRFIESRDMLSAYLRDNPFSEKTAEIKQRIREMDALIENLNSEDPQESL